MPADVTPPQEPTPEMLPAKWRELATSPEMGAGVVGQTYLEMAAEDLETALAARGPVVAVSELIERVGPVTDRAMYRCRVCGEWNWAGLPIKHTPVIDAFAPWPYTVPCMVGAAQAAAAEGGA